MNKKIIRVIIYEGPEEIIDRYEFLSLKGTRKGGIPKVWEKSWIDQNILYTQLRERNLPVQIDITGATILNINENESDIESKLEQLYHNLAITIEQHDFNKLDSPTKHGA